MARNTTIWKRKDYTLDCVFLYIKMSKSSEYTGGHSRKTMVSGSLQGITFNGYIKNKASLSIK